MPSWDPSHLDDWKPARKHPETYPGDRPPGSYLLLDDSVCPLLLDDRGLATVSTPGGEVALEDILERAGLPPLDERVGVLAYAGNRNPATLSIKLSNYGYACPGTAVAIPMLRGTLMAADVAACGLSGQGYLYGDLLVDPALASETRCEVWLALVDADQLRVLNESEIGTDHYVAARFPGVEVGRRLRAGVLGYAARRPCFVSPELGHPLAFGTVEAEGRTLPEMSPMAMLEHVFDVLGLADEVRTEAGVATGGPLAPAVARYMNRNWWRSFSGDEPEPGYLRIMALIDEGVAAHSLAQSTASIMASRGLAISEAEAYHPDESLRWGRL